MKGKFPAFKSPGHRLYSDSGPAPLSGRYRWSRSFLVSLVLILVLILAPPKEVTWLEKNFAVTQR